jgi:TonB-dependent receptor
MLFIKGNWITRNIGWMLLILLLFTAPVIARAATNGVAPTSSVSAAAAAASTTGVISGTVVDNGGAVLKGAQVKLLPLGITAVTDEQGEFTLINVPAGAYTISVSYVGFKPAEVKVQIAVGQALNQEIKMNVASASEDILVVAERPHGEAEAINQTRAADNILQVLPAEVITSLPNANVADAIGRLPSVTLYRIEGEGVYIQVRGTEPRLTNVTVDGITLPAPEPTVRQVRLDVIPSSLVESVEINKTLSANMDADGIGGSVNLRTKTAEEQPTIDAYAKMGYTPIMNGRYVGETGGTFGKRFGKAKKLGLLIDESYDYNGRGIDNIQPALDPYSTFAAPFYDDDTIRQYRYYRDREGLSGSADYKLSDNTTLYAHGLYSDLKDWGDKWYYEPVSNPLPSTGGTPITKLQAPKFYTSSKRPNASAGTLILGGTHIEKDSWFTVQLSASRSYEVDSAGNPKADFAWNTTKLLCNYNPAAQTDPNRPNFGACDGPNSPLEANPANWTFKDITISKGLTAELDLTGAVSYAHNYIINGHFGTFEAGFKFSNAHKSQDSTETVYDGWATTGSGIGSYTMAALQSGFENTDYYNGSYFGGKFGPVSDFNKVENLVLSNPTFFTQDAYKTALDNTPNIFHYVEQIPAFYVMNTVDLGSFHLQTGLRFEQTNMQTFGYNLTLDPNDPGGTPSGTTPTGPCTTGGQNNCWTINGVANNPSYLDVLPSVQLRYKLSANSNLRAVYSRGVARPDPYQLVPYVTEDDSANPVALTIGNPSLRPEHANNYDLLYENYLQPLGMIQVGFFAKQLTAPQVEFQPSLGINYSALPAGSLPPGMLATIEAYQSALAEPITVTDFVNGENAFLYGFEASFQQHLTYLPGVLGGVGITANYSYTGSKEKGFPLRTDSPRMIDQATNTWNISPTYDTRRFSLRVGLAYNGASVFSYNYVAPSLAPGAGADPSGLGPTGPSGDVWTLAHTQVDAQASYRAWRGLSVLASGLNLNNEVFGYYTGSTQFVNQREYYKPTYTFGVHYSFGEDKSARASSVPLQ